MEYVYPDSQKMCQNSRNQGAFFVIPSIRYCGTARTFVSYGPEYISPIDSTRHSI